MDANDHIEMDVVLNLQAPGNLEQDVLEEHMFEVLNAVEQHGPSEALGPVVAVNFADNSIELAFTVETSALSTTQAIASRVLEAIETHTELHFSGAGTSASEPDPTHDFELAC